MENKRPKIARAIESNDALPDFNPAWLTQAPRLRADASVFKETSSRNYYIGAVAAVLCAAVGIAVFLRQGSGEIKQTASRGLVVSVSGETSVDRSGKKSALYNGDVVTEGDRIQTGKDARVEIALAGHSVRILENTDVTLLELKKSETGSRAVSLDVGQGTVLGSVRKLTPGESFQVRTPVAIAGVRGTRFSVAVSGSSAQVRLYDGAVDVKGSAGETVLVPGDGIQVSKDTVEKLSADSTDHAQQLLEMESRAQEDAAVLAAADSMKSAKSEKELKDIYQRIEIVRLRDGRVFRGVTTQVGSRAVIQTPDGMHIVQSSEIEDVSYPEEP